MAQLKGTTITNVANGSTAFTVIGASGQSADYVQILPSGNLPVFFRITASSNVQIGQASGGTYNGNIWVQPADRFPLIAARTGNTITSQILFDALSGNVFIDVPNGLSVRNQVGGGIVMLSVASSSCSFSVPLTLSNGHIADDEIVHRIMNY